VNTRWPRRCAVTVKANNPLTGRELENLVEHLRRCAMPYTYPHGRPTLIETNYRELEKKFGRTKGLLQPLSVPVRFLFQNENLAGHKLTTRIELEHETR